MSIELRQLTKRFGTVTAAEGISLQVNDGELVALLGPSGSGKTTVLRMIAGLENPTGGEVLINGRVVNPVPVQRRNIGFVFQGYALFPSMTVSGNIAFGLRVKKWEPDHRQARIAELLKIFGLEELEERYPHQLSGGQRQRVAIARALAPKPDVLLLDEPFAAVDAKIRQELREWLVRLHDELNLTTIFVTHDQEEAMEVAHRIVVFNRGRLEQMGSPRDVYEEPANETVARFIGVMNVLELQVSKGAARLHELVFPTHGVTEGQLLRIGFRPYAVQISASLGEFRYSAIVRHVFFLGVLLRIELVTRGGLVIRARMTKEEFNRLGLAEDQPVSFQIREYRVLAREGASLSAEVAQSHQSASFAEGI